MVRLVRTAINIIYMVAALLLQKLLPGSNKTPILLEWMVSFIQLMSVHELYEGNRPGAALLGANSKRDETSLARLHSGHTRAQRHVVGLIVYPPCPNCNVAQFASAHILACIGC
ncbi:hypothetical protein TNCV_3309671 [Trichonephila clavipes]|nr:hypothetical protein TNCV_3309671 [Trichonephila clavipes]